ncbi:MAG: AraC family transcriptional regulator, partial [Pedobacter sp.]
MKKEDFTPHQFDSISDLHRMLGLPKPFHPLVTLVDNTHISVDKEA